MEKEEANMGWKYYLDVNVNFLHLDSHEFSFNGEHAWRGCRRDLKGDVFQLGWRQPFNFKKDSFLLKTRSGVLERHFTPHLPGNSSITSRRVNFPARTKHPIKTNFHEAIRAFRNECYLGGHSIAPKTIRGHSQRTSALEGEGGVWPMRTLVDVRRGVFAAADVLF